MAQHLSGRWTVQVREVGPYPDHSYVVRGSDAADGRHHVTFLGDNPARTITGGDWTLEIHVLVNGQWVPDAAHPPVPQGGQRCVPEVRPDGGLVMHVGTGTVAWDELPAGVFRFSGVRLLCTSHDPDLNPGPLPPHPEFTIPKPHGSG